jgi:hypothetical protein
MLLTAIILNQDSISCTVYCILYENSERYDII